MTEIRLCCDDCGEVSEKKNHHSLVDDGWNWMIAELDATTVTCALCPECYTEGELGRRLSDRIKEELEENNE